MKIQNLNDKIMSDTKANSSTECWVYKIKYTIIWHPLKKKSSNFDPLVKSCKGIVHHNIYFADVLCAIIHTLCAIFTYILYHCQYYYLFLYLYFILTFHCQYYYLSQWAQFFLFTFYNFYSCLHLRSINIMFKT